MSKSIELDLEDVYYLLNLLPAMKDINDPARYMKIIADIHDQAQEPEEEEPFEYATGGFIAPSVPGHIFANLSDPNPFLEKWKSKFGKSGSMSIGGQDIGKVTDFKISPVTEVKIPYDLLVDTENTAGDFSGIEKMIHDKAAADIEKMVLYGTDEPTYFKLPKQENFPNMVKCIKFIREVMGIGLKEAKDAFDYGTNLHIGPKWNKAMLEQKAEEAGLEIEFS